MNIRQPKNGTVRRRRRRRVVTRDDEVGYGRPPRAHQFEAGRSGNPRGRPKGAKNETTILRELLNRKIEIREAGRSRKITVFEAILLRFTEDALKGNTKTAAFLFNRYANQAGGQEVASDISSDDRLVLDAFLQRLESSHKQKGQRS